MTVQFELELQKLKDHLLAMAGLVEKAIDAAIAGLQDLNRERIDSVFALEKKTNQSHKTADETIGRLIALNQPMAKDMRFLISAIKINADLERMGDQAVNIANNGLRYLNQGPVKDLIDIPTMCTVSRRMVRDALDAFIQVNVNLAKEVLDRDDQLDDLKDKVFHDVVAIMKKDPQTIEAGLDLILIARNLEKIGDHATNIAEEVIYIVSGKDIRHPVREPKAL